MLRRVLLAVTALVVLAVGAAAAGLGWAHLAVRREAAPLPSLDAVEAAMQVDDAPVELSVINTASQVMPRGAVLDPGRDPSPDAPYVMSHPSFVLEWRDGRLLLVDAGMTRAEALQFGQPIALLGGGEPMMPVISTAEALGEAARRVQGAVFTHLHTDHVEGIGALCAAIGHPIRVPMTEAQAERPNYTTRPGLKLLRAAPCVRDERASGAALLPLAGFPGVYLVAAGGHTPGSQIVLAVVRGPAGARRYAFTGDIVNHLDGIAHDVPKPFLYRTLMVPEAEPRQAELRAFLKRLRDEAGFTLLVSHDQNALVASGVPVWGEQLEGEP